MNIIDHKRMEGAMAKPIKETPVLYGKDSERFAAKIEQNKTRTVPKEEYDRVMENYRKIEFKKTR